MCGIWALFGELLDEDKIRQYLSLLKNRGPESEKLYVGPNYQLGFTRLALNGLKESGMQPMHDAGCRWVCNGEIYNWKDIANEIGFQNKSGSDCEVLGASMLKSSSLGDFFRKLHGVFAIVMVKGNQAIVGRDPYGVRPLFLSKTESRIILASELKGIPSWETPIPFPPGHYATINLTTLEIEYCQYHIITPVILPIDTVFSTLRNTLIRAVQRRMMTERPIAALLSGGLDSSLIAALVQRELKNARKPSLETFSIGFYGSEDLKYARKVAEHIGSTHTEITMTPTDFFDTIPCVVRDIESYDITTVRASVGNWLVAREIAKSSSCKVVFNGDGSDEVLGGYLYFYKAPNEYEFEKESDRLLKDIHLFDVLRSDRCISSHGLEPRTPFLDKDFVNVVKSIPVEMRRPSSTQMEKWVLRESFKDTGLLPNDVLYRKKEAFSDGVSSSNGLCWYQECQQRSETLFPAWKKESEDIVHLQPHTAEAYYYRMLFDAYYPKMETVIPYFWMPKWSPETTDPSARTLVHEL